MAKTTLDKQMEEEGWIKYTHIEKAGLFGIDIHDKDLMATLQAHKIPYEVRTDPEIPNNDTFNSLYVREKDYKKVCNLCSTVT